VTAPSVVVNNENSPAQTHFRLFSGKPRLIGPKGLSKFLDGAENFSLMAEK
jgi:hypothetical protein